MFFFQQPLQPKVLFQPVVGAPQPEHGVVGFAKISFGEVVKHQLQPAGQLFRYG